MHYEDYIETITMSLKEDWMYDDEVGRYVLKTNVSISILADREYDERFNEEWVETFSDSTAYANRYNLLYNGSVVETFYATAVDGYRMLIPYPRRQDMTISRRQYGIGVILNKPYTDVIDQYDDYLSMAQISIREEE